MVNDANFLIPPTLLHNLRDTFAVRIQSVPEFRPKCSEHTNVFMCVADNQSRDIRYLQDQLNAIS